MSENSVKLIEVFNTWQGEGPDSGKSMLILRFKTCNLKCPWCDTRVKMRITPEAEYPLEQLQEILKETGAGILVTGGEPTVNKHFWDTVLLLTKLEYPIANVESNGHQLVKLIQQVGNSKPINYIFSPKIFTNTDSDFARQTAVDLFSKFPLDKFNINIKIVYEPQNLLIESFLEWLSTSILIPNQSVYLMPEGVTRADLIKNSEKVFDAAEKYKFNFSSRDHIIYGFV